MSTIIDKIKTYAKPNAQQKLLLILDEIPIKTPEDLKKIKALIAAETAADKAEKAKAAAASVLRNIDAAEQKKNRKARNHRLILDGTLIEMAGLDGWSRGEILGALLAVSRASCDDEKRAGWKQAGDALLTEKGEVV